MVTAGGESRYHDHVTATVTVIRPGTIMTVSAREPEDTASESDSETAIPTAEAALDRGIRS